MAVKNRCSIGFYQPVIQIEDMSFCLPGKHCFLHYTIFAGSIATVCGLIAECSFLISFVWDAGGAGAQVSPLYYMVSWDINQTGITVIEYQFVLLIGFQERVIQFFPWRDVTTEAGINQYFSIFIFQKGSTAYDMIQSCQSGSYAVFTRMGIS